MQSAFIGIDPGVAGGVAIVSDYCAPWCRKMPDFKERRLVKKAIQITLQQYDVTVCCVERVQAGPRMGSGAAFGFGRGFGWLEGIIDALTDRLILVQPAHWQGIMECRTGGDKNISKRRAQDLFPELGKAVNHATADALLIAAYARRVYTGREAQYGYINRDRFKA